MFVILPKEFNRIAVDAAGSVDLFGCHLCRVLYRLPVNCRAAGRRSDTADDELRVRVRAAVGFCARVIAAAGRKGEGHNCCHRDSCEFFEIRLLFHFVSSIFIF